MVPKEIYFNFASKIGSATAQQIINKNNEAWKSYFALLKKKKDHKLPKHIKRVKPPRYWKDRISRKRRLIVIVRVTVTP
ncbi:TPA: hypothetical protein EYP44_02885 [Candidatus Bathyarchaeota archaeon]|nr:hypothetical protein [Candidatus Bathyarchaeota archaeon]